MKSILLISSLVVASTGAFAQSKAPAATTPATPQNAAATRQAPAANTPATPQTAAPTRQAPPTFTPVSKNAFVEEVKQFNDMLTPAKAQEAKAKFEEVNKMLTNALRDGQIRMRDAMQAKDESGRKPAMENINKQRTLYAEIMKLRQEDMITNKEKLNAKLIEFSNTIQ